MIKGSYLKDGKQFTLVLKQVQVGPGRKATFQIARQDATGKTEKVHYLSRPTPGMMKNPMLDVFRELVNSNKLTLINDDEQPAPWEVFPEVQFSVL